MEAADFFREFASKHPDTNPQLDIFPSGSVILNLSIGGIYFAAEYREPLKSYGLSKCDGAGFGWEGFDESFSTANELEARLNSLIQAARVALPQACIRPK